MEVKCTVDEQELVYNVVTPSNKDLQDAQMQYSIKMAQLMRSDERLLSRTELQRYMREHMLWTKQDEDLMEMVQKQLRTMERKLAEGGMTKDQGKEIAVQMKYNRSILLALTNKKTQMDSLTMESVAENHRFKFLMTRCIKNASNECVVRSVEECDNRQDDPVVVQCAAALNSIIYGYDPEFFEKLPENSWLKQYGYINKDGRLADPSGKPVSIAGKLIDDNGRYVDQDGNFVDVDGNRVDEEGRFIIDNPKPFTDDTKTVKKKRTTGKKKTKV